MRLCPSVPVRVRDGSGSQGRVLPPLMKSWIISVIYRERERERDIYIYIHIEPLLLGPLLETCLWVNIVTQEAQTEWEDSDSTGQRL